MPPLSHFSGQPLRLVRTSQSAKSRQGGAFTAAPGLGSRQGLDWIAIPPPIARKHAPFIGEFLVSLVLAKIGTHSLTL